MEQAEKALREIIFFDPNLKSPIKRRPKLFKNFSQNKYLIEYLNNCIIGNKKGKINDYVNPTKEKVYELIEDLSNILVVDANLNETIINRMMLYKINEYFHYVEINKIVNEQLKKAFEISNDLRKGILEKKNKIKKNEEETIKFIKKLEEKKKNENDELFKLKDELHLIKYEQKKIEKENLDILLKLEEKTHLSQLKEEELLKFKKDNKNLNQEIDYYTKGIKIQTQVNNDIQGYKNQMNNEYQEAKGNVRVFCRIRPPLQREISKPKIDIEYRGDNSLIIKGEKKMNNIGKGVHQDIEQFQFNRIFKQNDTQEDVFEEVSPLIQSSLDGFNINIFAYGQTGSGKTFTMEGDMSSPDKYGIVPRSVDKIFKYFEEELKNMGWEIKFYLSVCEIYNKKTRDLLGEKNVEKTEELKEMKINNLIEWNSNFGQIAQRRKVAETKMNMESSRSHLIFKIKILLHNNNGLEDDRYGSLNLIDLAGSERVDKSTVSEERFKESIEINSSLTHLKSVFEAMKSKHDKFVPFHNTPLTDVLKDCLSGDNSKTLMFVNISPLLESFKESTCSLKFATDVNKCYVSANDEGSDEDNDKTKETNCGTMDLDI